MGGEKEPAVAIDFLIRPSFGRTPLWRKTIPMRSMLKLVNRIADALKAWHAELPPLSAASNAARIRSRQNRRHSRWCRAPRPCRVALRAEDGRELTV